MPSFARGGGIACFAMVVWHRGVQKLRNVIYECPLSLNLSSSFPEMGCFFLFSVMLVANQTLQSRLSLDKMFRSRRDGSILTQDDMQNLDKRCFALIPFVQVLDKPIVLLLIFKQDV